MAFEKEHKILDGYLRDKGLKQSAQRRDILNAFLKTEGHMTVEDLHKIVKRKNPSIGIATIYRALKMFCECGLCRELRIGDGMIRYEHKYGHAHHDHFTCLKCNKLIEATDPEIERLQEKLARKIGFKLQGHLLILYGLCKECK